MFVKAGATPLTNRFLRREIQVYRAVSADFMPRLLAWDDSESSPILIIDEPQNMAGERSAHLEPLIEAVTARGYACETRTVAYEFQKGGKEMLRIAKR